MGRNRARVTLLIPEYHEEEELLIQPESPHPYHLYRLFLTDEILEKIVMESNNYARQQIEAMHPLPPNARARKWVEVTVPELKTYLGICLIMSLVTRPSTKDYWCTKSKKFGHNLIKKINES